MSSILRVHRILPRTRANGPGWRAALWLQGCTLHCAGCFNEGTHAPGGGRAMTVEAVVASLCERAVEGISISGGEPLQQKVPLLEMLRLLPPHLSVVLFSGYPFAYIERFHPEILGHVDVLLAGPYDASRRVADRLIGSSNKTVHFLTDRYRATDLDAVPQAEAVILPDGEVVFTGIDPLR